MADTRPPLTIEDLNRHYRKIAEAAISRGYSRDEALEIAISSMPR